MTAQRSGYTVSPASISVTVPPDATGKNFTASLPSALAFSGIVIGTAISNVLGGILGDWAEGVSPKYGRTVIGQISIFCGSLI